MHLYLVYVKSTFDPLSGETAKSVGSIRVAVGNVPMNNQEMDEKRKALIGDQIALWLTAEDSSEIETKLIESGFKTSIDFIQNYSKVI